jgi:hypothetical protein
MTKHYPKISNSNKSALAEEYGNGTCSAMIGKNIFTINLPRTISDLMSIEYGTELDYKLLDNQLLISVKGRGEE